MEKMNKKYYLSFLIIIILFGILFFVPNKRDNNRMKDQKKTSQKPAKKITQSTVPTLIIDKNKHYAAILETTAGIIELSLFADKTPITVNNFITLTKKKFYNKTIFHRVIKGFMIQGGDPKGNGTGGPGYQFDDEPFEGEYMRGIVAMANAGPNTNGSQFFIMHQDNPLPKNYVIFGKITKGIEVVDKIAESKVESNEGGELSKPTIPITINSITIK
ncbi:MAG TPA: peptidylprolyl isomerase [Patescibacteria group bacterium]|nr:peptidylprolyl isomerase [Patescibacteria group bacterium]